MELIASRLNADRLRQASVPLALDGVTTRVNAALLGAGVRRSYSKGLRWPPGCTPTKRARIQTSIS